MNNNEESFLKQLGNIIDKNNFQRKTREDYIAIHNSCIEEAKKKKLKFSEDNSSTNYTIDLEQYNPLGKNIEKDFSEIKINNLQLNTIHKKKYIILKIISKIFIIKSTNFLGEDNNKDVTNISIDNSEKYFDNKDWDNLEKEIYTEGKYIIIIEPNYKIYNSGSDRIKVESPNEIIILKNEEELNYFLDKIKNISPENYKLLGNLMIKNHFYEKAIYYYTEGIILNNNIKKDYNNNNIDIDMDIILHSNLSEAFIKYGYFTKCIQNADYCLDKINILIKDNKFKDKLNFLLQQKIKALYRKIKGFFSLRKFKEAYDILFNISKDNPNKDIIKEFINLEQIKKMIDTIKNGYENNLGHFNFKKMLEDEKINYNLENYGDYLNSKIEIKYEEGKGIKVSAKEKIKEGELIFVEKSLSFLYKKEKKGKNFEQLIKVSIQNPSKTSEFELFNKLTEKIIKSPLDYEKFYYLYDGKNLDEDLNKRRKYLEKQENGKIKLTKDKINGVICNNKYGIGRYIIFYNEKGKGVWGYPSFLNHDCLPNTTYFGIGDFYISFCIKEINKGEEVTSSYCSSIYTYEQRQKILSENWGFKCICSLCKFQENKKDPDYNNFILLFTNLKPETINKISIDTVHFFEEFLEKNKKKYSCYELANGYLQLETYYMHLKDLNNTKKFSELVTKYAGEKNYLFQISNLYTLAICINECNAKMNGIYGRELFSIMQDIQNLLKKYTPFTREEIECFINDNINQREIDLEENN